MLLIVERTERASQKGSYAMSGRVLLVDSVSTNRIILKVKLSAAYYDVTQAHSLEEAVALLPGAQPDLILVNARSLKQDAQICLERLRPEADGIDPPVVLLAETPDDALRVSALRAGFDDILSLPAKENFMQARLRGLMRRRHTAQTLQAHSVTARALGFAETQQAFERKAQISVISTDVAIAANLRGTLGQMLPQNISVIDSEKLMAHIEMSGNTSGQTDLCIVDVRNMFPEDALRLVADLRATAAMQNCPILPFVKDDAGNLAAALLDMGLDDILFASHSPAEIALRVVSQVHEKRATDNMRDHIQNSLQAAVTDPLTGLYNRRYALSFLKGLLSRKQDSGKTFAVMVADLDHFKRINDTYGHAAGDAVLTHVAEALGGQLDQTDLVARIGGEEFLIVLPDTTRFKTNDVAKGLCKAVRSLTLPLPGQAEQVAVTISIGVTLSNASERADMPIDARVSSLLEQADQALYRSKACGRNTVTLAARSAA